MLRLTMLQIDLYQCPERQRKGDRLLYHVQCDSFLEILFYDGNQVDDKIACGLGEGFICIN